MRRYFIAPMIAFSLIAAPTLIGGCEEGTETKKIEVKDDGTVKKESTATKEHADGSVTKTETKEVKKP